MRRAQTLLALLALSVLIPAAAQARGPRRHIISCMHVRTFEECRSAVEANGWTVRRELRLIHALVVEFPETEMAALDTKIAARPEILSAEEDKYVKWIKTEELNKAKFEFPPVKEMVKTLSADAAKRPAPIDPPSANPVQPMANGKLPWGIARVNAPTAWKTSMGAGVKVAVIDTGIDAGHAALSANVKGGFNALDEAHPNDFKDDQGHGSHVAGTIAAVYNGGAGAGGSGVVGVAPQASLYGVKVLDAQGGGNYSSIIAGIEWAVNNGMQIANMSLGAPEGTEALRQAVIKAKEAGLVIMAAAGNDSGAAVGYPAAYPETICISASNNKDGFATFSSKGPEVDFIAPGQDILSVKMGGGYIAHSGTSMATPHMTGLGALAIATGARGYDGVKRALSNASTKLPGLTQTQQGEGLIDAAKVVR